MGILLGKDKPRGKIDTTHLQIYENESSSGREWKKAQSMKFDFDYACREFQFANHDNKLLYFFTAEEIFQFDYETSKKTTFYKYKNTLES